MTRIPIAHINQQGQNIIIVPLDRSFAFKSPGEQAKVIGALQSAARSASLAGRVVPVWDAGGGGMAFIAPKPWWPFFKSLSLYAVARSLNGELVVC